MLLIDGEPEYRLWIDGAPKSRQSSIFQRYRDSIQLVARQHFSAPLSARLEVDVVFADKRATRPDTDNVLKPIMDALKGIAYGDDSQVISAKAHLLPLDDTVRTVNETSPHFYSSLRYGPVLDPSKNATSPPFTTKPRHPDSRRA